MTYLDKYAERIRVAGVGTAEGSESRIKDSIIRDFELSPSYKEVCVVLPNLTIVKRKIQTTRKTVGVDRIFVHPEENLETGSIILQLQDYAWIVTEVKKIADVFQQANIKRVNRTLKWMNGTEIVEMKSLVSSFSREDGVEDSAFILLPENMITVLIQKNLKTINLKRDKRLMIDQVPYKITRLDPFTYENCVILILVEDMLHPNDTSEICDFIEAEPVVPFEKGIVGTEVIKLGMQEKYTFEDETGILTAGWSLVNPVDYATLTFDADGVWIQVSRNTKDISKTLILQAQYNAQYYQKTIMIGSLV